MNRPAPGGAGPRGGRDGGMQTGKAALVIVAVLLVGWLILRHNPKTHTASTTSTTKAAAATSPTTAGVSSTPSTTVVPPASVKLQVLNGTGSGNLAGQWATKLKSTPGYNTLAPDDATSKVAQSEIFVLTPGYLPEAYALATTVGLASSAVVTTVPPPASAPIPAKERSTANLVLVIGNDLAGSA